MSSNKVNAKDFYHLTWKDFDRYAKNIASDIKSFCERANVHIDFICPIIRGGSVLATYLSHLLGVIPCIGVQIKNFNYDPPKLLWECFSFFPEKKRIEKEYVVLLVEGNHCSGSTALKAYELLKMNFPKIKIIYASLARDYYHRDVLSDVIFSTTGYYSNESEKLQDPKILKEHRIPEKLTLFPWESLQEEIDECNRVNIKIDTSLI